MADPWDTSPPIRIGFGRYASMIARFVNVSSQPKRPDAVDALSIESNRSGGVRVVDRLGHDRPLYKPFLAYSLARSAAAAVPVALADFGADWDGPATAAAGDRVAAVVWGALATLAMGTPVNAGPLATMRRLIDGQQANGAFLLAGRGDNLESLWFHELAILHAVASFAVQAREPGLWPAVARAVRYHVEETQPDHATNQPWGVTAFLLEPEGWPLADSMLHAASSHAAVERDASQGLTLMLLADALYCLHQLGIYE